MENLKLKSIRLSKKDLGKAEELSAQLTYYTTSDIIRVAIWVGLKFIQPRVISELLRMMWQEEFNGVSYDARDVLRTAGEELEKLKNVE